MTLPFSRNFRFFLAVFIPALVLRGIFLITLDEDILFYKYPYFADKLAAGESIGERLTDLSPVYLYLLTLFRWLTPFDWNLFKIFQAVTGALNCWLAAELGRRVFASRTIGLLAGWGLAAYGNLIILEATLEPTVFVIFFNLLAVTGLYRFADASPKPQDPPATRWLVLSAIFTGVSILTKPSFLLFIPLAAAWICILAGRQADWGTSLKQVVLLGAIAMCIVFTVTLRNYLLLADRILVTANAGKVFYHGNTREATATKWAGVPGQGFMEDNSEEPDYAHVAFRIVAAERSGRKLKPSEASRFWTKTVLQDIAAEPNRYLARQLDKFLFFFADYELHYIASAYKEYKTSLGWPFLRYSTLAALGLAGMLMAIGRFKRLIPVYGMVGLYLVSGLIYVVQSRYRIPAAPYLCIFAAFAVHQALRWLKSRRLPAFFALAAGVTLLTIGSRNVLQEQISATDSWFMATKYHYELGAQFKFKAGRHKQAVAAATRALEIAPDFAQAYILRGKSHALIGQHPDAIRDFEKVVQLHPNRPEGYRNLGFVYLITGAAGEAGVYLEKALELDPGDRKAAAALETLKAQTDPGS